MVFHRAGDHSTERLITLFEHQRRTFRDLGLGLDDPILTQLDELNQTAEAELIHVGRHHLGANHFVGVIRVGQWTFQILPKIDYDLSHSTADPDARPGSSPHQAAATSATRNLLHLLSYTHDLQIREQDVAPLLSQRSDWFEILTGLLALHLHRLLKGGVDRAYVLVDDVLPVMRGRWLVSRQLKERPHVRHLFDLSFDEFSPDTQLNQVFRYVTDRLLVQTRHSVNRRYLRDIREWLGQVHSPGLITSDHLDGILFTRLNDHFRPAFNLARLFVENEALQLTAGLRRSFAFVFDMNRLFEEFVARFLIRHHHRVLPQTWRNIEIRRQGEGRVHYLAEKVPEGKRVFRLQPDVVLTRPGGRPVLILDTKYKNLKSGDGTLGVAESDVYQMQAYAASFDCPRTLLVYPQSARSSRVLAHFQTLGHRNHLVVATVNLHRPLHPPEGLIGELEDTLTTLAVLE